MATVLDTLGTQKEQVRQALVELYEMSDQVAGKIRKASSDRVKVSRYLYRIPIELYLGGQFHKIDMNGGSMGIGTGMKNSYLTAGFISTARSYRVTDEQQSTTGTQDQSTINVMQRTLAKIPKQAQIDDDITLHTDGTGKLTGASSAVTSTTMTFAGATDYWGVNNIKEGMGVDVWDATGATKRAGAAAVPTIITNIDYYNKIITLSQAITGITATDLLAFPDLDVYGPATLVSYSSTWPGGGLTNGGGLTGDSFRHGIRYVNDATTSNYYLGRLKSTISQLLPSYVDGLSGQITFDMILKGLDQITQRRDSDATKGLTGIFHLKQRRSLFGQGVNISNWNRGQTSDKMPDLMPSNTDYTADFDTCGVACCVDKRQFDNRVDYLNFKLWGRVETKPPDFRRANGPDGGYISTVRNSDGTQATQVEFHWVSEMDFCCYDPGNGLYIDGLAVT